MELVDIRIPPETPRLEAIHLRIHNSLDDQRLSLTAEEAETELRRFMDMQADKLRIG